MAYLSDISPYKQRSLQAVDADLKRQMSEYKSFDFNLRNPYEGMQNVFEDMTIDTRATQLRQEALGQQQADILQGLQAGTGASGAAALASGLARQAAKSQREIAADISQQEQNIQMKRLGAEQEMQQRKMEAQFQIDQRAQEMEYARMSEMLGMTMDEKAAAELAQQEEEAERAALGGAIGSVVLGAVGGVVGGPVGASLGASLGGSLGSAIAG